MPGLPHAPPVTQYSEPYLAALPRPTVLRPQLLARESCNGNHSLLFGIFRAIIAKDVPTGIRHRARMHSDSRAEIMVSSPLTPGTTRNSLAAMHSPSACIRPTRRWRSLRQHQVSGQDNVMK